MHKNIQELPEYSKLILDDTDRVEVSKLVYISSNPPLRAYHDSHSITVGEIYDIFASAVKVNVEACVYDLNSCVNP